MAMDTPFLILKYFLNPIRREMTTANREHYKEIN